MKLHPLPRKLWLRKWKDENGVIWESWIGCDELPELPIDMEWVQVVKIDDFDRYVIRSKTVKA